MSKNNLVLTGTYQNIEHAIVEGIKILSPFSEYEDGSVRSKDLFNLVKNAAINVDGQVQQGNHRFTLFSSALCGRVSSMKLFKKINARERHGSWWALKVPYEEAIAIIMSLHPRRQSTLSKKDEQMSRPEEIIAPRTEIVRHLFMSFVPLTLSTSHLENTNKRLEESINTIQEQVRQARSEASPETIQRVDQLISFQKRFDDLSQERLRNDNSLSNANIFHIL